MRYLSRDAVDEWEVQRYLATVPGGFSEAPFLAGGFTVQLLTFLATTGLLVYLCRRVPPPRLGKCAAQQFFGFRIALGLYSGATFFAWVFMAGANSDGLNTRYLIFSIIPLALSFAAEVTLLYTLIRLAWQPLVHARSYRHARAVGIGLCTWFGLTTLTLWATWVAEIAAEIHDVETTPDEENWSDSFEQAEGAYSIAHLLYWCTGALWGLVVMGAAIDALRKSRGAVKHAYRIVPKMIIPASILWFARYVLFFMFSIETQYGIRFTVLNGRFYRSDFTPTVQPLVQNGLMLSVLVLCFLCFRAHLLDFYTDTLGDHFPDETGREEQHRTDPSAFGTELPSRGPTMGASRSDGVALETSKGNESDNERHPAAFV